MTAPLPIDNRTARRLFLDRHALSDPPGRKQSKGDLLALIDRLGFVQVDSVNTLARAHDLILFARNQTYQPKHLKALLERDRALFENWTHDASIIPSRFFPYWRAKFERHREQLMERWRSWRREGFEEEFDRVHTHVRTTGPTLCREITGEAAHGGDGWWDWKPSKTAMEYLWRTGDLCVCGREGFQKVYDLTERVIPKQHLCDPPSEPEFIDWACQSALDRLGVATSGELAAFWDLVTAAEARAWCAERVGRDLIQVAVATADSSKPRVQVARPEIEAEIAKAPEPPARIRALSPFDPAIRDRKRALRLLGFNYRIEIFVPAPKRRSGYYVFPLLEGDRLIGRIDMKRQGDVLAVTALWPEPKVKISGGRMARLEAELARLAKFGGCREVAFADGWLRAPH